MTIPLSAHRATILYFLLLLVFLAVSRSHQDAMPKLCSMRIIPRWLEEACEVKQDRASSTRSTHRRRPITQPTRFGKRSGDVEGMTSLWSPLLDADLRAHYTHILLGDSQMSDQTRFVPDYFPSWSSSLSSPSSSSVSTLSPHRLRHWNRLISTDAKSYMDSREHLYENDVRKRIQRNARLPKSEFNAFTKEAIKETLDKIVQYGARRNTRTGRAS